MSNKSNAGKIWDSSRYNFEFRFETLLLYYNNKSNKELDKISRKDWKQLPTGFKKFLIKKYG